MSNPTIAIIKITKLNNAGCLRALVDFKLGESEFYSWRIIQQDKQDAWVSSPQETWEADGQKHYKPLIKLNKDLMVSVSEAILTVYNRVDAEQSPDATSAQNHTETRHLIQSEVADNA